MAHGHGWHPQRARAKLGMHANKHTMRLRSLPEADFLEYPFESAEKNKPTTDVQRKESRPERTVFLIDPFIIKIVESSDGSCR